MIFFYLDIVFCNPLRKLIRSKVMSELFSLKSKYYTSHLKKPLNIFVRNKIEKLRGTIISLENALYQNKKGLNKHCWSLMLVVDIDIRIMPVESVFVYHPRKFVIDKTHSSWTDSLLMEMLTS